jgi:hypothetical protein
MLVIQEDIFDITAVHLGITAGLDKQRLFDYTSRGVVPAELTPSKETRWKRYHLRFTMFWRQQVDFLLAAPEFRHV